MNQLFAYWVVEGTDHVTASVNQINDPGKRFLAVSRMIEENYENESFYFQLKLYAKSHEHARPFLEQADQKRSDFGTKLFRDAGQSEEEVNKNWGMMKLFFMGRHALMMGFDPDPNYPELSGNELLEMFGLKS